MKIHVLNVTRSHGIAKKTRAPYDIFQLERLVHIENVESSNVDPQTGEVLNSYTLESGNKGFTVRAEQVSPAIFPSLQAEFWKHWTPDGGPVVMDVEIDLMARRSSIVSFKPSSAMPRMAA